MQENLILAGYDEERQRGSRRRWQAHSCRQRRSLRLYGDLLMQQKVWQT